MKTVRYIAWTVVTLGMLAVVLMPSVLAGAGQKHTPQQPPGVVGLHENGAAAAQSPEPGQQESVENIAEQQESVPELPTFTQVDTEYFRDALFIGDSRTVGLSRHGDLGEADVFADEGLTVYRLFDVKVETEEGEQTLEELLATRKYGKIYIMLGINELGYRMERTVEKYGEMLSAIRQLQPESLLFLQANLHVTGEFSERDKIFTNPQINAINAAISQMADGRTSFYLDVNEIFDDSEGNLDVTYASDELHIQVKYYPLWVEWLRSKGILL